MDIPSEQEEQFDSSSDDSSDSAQDIQLRPPRYHLPGQEEGSKKKRIRQAGPRSHMTPQPLRRGERQRRPPERFQAGQRNQQTAEYVFYVDPSEIVYT